MGNSYFADISSNNGSFNAAVYRSSSFRPLLVMVKATEDRWYVNPFHTEWTTTAHAHGVGVIHYHFARPENGNPTWQMKHFWDAVEPHFHRPGDFVCIDLETDTPSNAARWLMQADGFLAGISDTHPILYTPLSYLEEGRLRNRSGRIHVAAWGRNRPGDWRWRLPNGLTLFAWQGTDGRHFWPGPLGMPGIPGTCDVNQLSPSVARNLTKQLRSKKNVNDRH